MKNFFLLNPSMKSIVTEKFCSWLTTQNSDLAVFDFVEVQHSNNSCSTFSEHMVGDLCYNTFLRQTDDGR